MPKNLMVGLLLTSTNVLQSLQTRRSVIKGLLERFMNAQ
jgi:hypothetical protein